MTTQESIVQGNHNLPTPYYDHAGITIYNCDCREILPLLPKVDLVLTDPPYGTDATHSGHLSTITLRNGEPARQVLGFDGISMTECVALTRQLVGIASRWVIFTCEWRYMHALQDAGLLVRFGIWRKPDGSPQFTGDRPGTGWEAIAICHRPGRKRWNGGGAHAVWTFPKGQNDSGHPTGKPIGLLRSFVEQFSDTADLILDPFMGSGTTLVAAKQLGRRAIGIEIEERYCEIAAKRLSQEVLPFAEPAPEPVQDALFGGAA